MQSVRKVAESMTMSYHVDTNENEGGIGKEHYQAIARAALQTEVQVSEARTVVLPDALPLVEPRVAEWDSTVLHSQLVAGVQVV